MDIEKLVRVEAKNDTEHDKCYAAALRGAYDVYKEMSKKELLEWQSLVKIRYGKQGPTHKNVASCVVIYELLKEGESR